ncbi:MAG: UDP-N-acetylmuramoyl-L-alanine--D-glutamate ligase [Bacteroidetes bacterium]|nr:UDP-N-acetylmuramoyl-L-alanine--D-glutamate ligase [Bacteroidota bacterium]
MAKRVVILGGGESGAGTAVLAGKKGFDVFLSDSGRIRQKYKEVLSKYDIEWEEGTHTEPRILKADEVIKSPGIPETAPLVLKIRKKGISVVSEIEFAARFTDAKTICITGSNGKTTTTLLTYHILKNGGLNVGLAGNVGRSFALQVAEEQFDYYVIELSSFQLDGMFNFKADLGIMLNITPDHLDRYEYSFDRYIASKFRLLQNQTADDYFIYCADDEVIRKEIDKREIPAALFPFSLKEKVQQGAYAANNKLNIKFNNYKFTMSILELTLQGSHNTYNSMAAGIAASILQIRKQTIRECLADFQGVEHRLEPVIKVHGIQFFNDSKATNVNSTWYALETIRKPIIWIVGGVDKGNDYSVLLSLVKEKVKAIICLGVDNTRIHEAFEGVVRTIVDTRSMTEAVRTAYYLGAKGDNALLSPACASFDLFEDFEDRGRQFKAAVRNL